MLGSKAWRNKTKERYLFIHCWTSRWFLLFYSLKPRSRSMNFNIPELVYCDDVFRDRIIFWLAFYSTFSRENESSAPSISASISFPESALPLSSGWQLCGKWNSKFALKSTDLLKLFDSSTWKTRTCSSGYAWGFCTYPRAHNPERATSSMRSCHGVFTNQFNFRTVLARNLNIF